MKRAKAICSILLCGVMLSANVLSVCASESKKGETGIIVKWPGAGEDASPAIQDALEAAERVEGPVTIEFEEGKQYDVYPETAYHNMNYYISNAATKGENPNGERWSAIFMKDMESVTVEGNDAMLNIHGVMTPILLDKCKNITFQNLHVDWARPTMSELNVTEVGDNYAKVQVGQGSLFNLENEGRTLRWVSEEKPGGGYYWTLTGGLTVKQDPVANTARGSSFPYPVKYVEEGDGILRLEYNGRPALKVGDNYQFRSGSRDQVGSFIHKSENVKFKNMGFHYMHGLGIVGQYTKNLSFENLDCTPRKETGRKCASSADFIQISGCSGLVSVTDSKFSGAHDDVFNIHGTHLRIVDKDEEGNKITVRFMQERSWGFQAFDIGDEIEFVKPDTMLNYASNKVKEFNRLDDYLIELTLEEPLPEGIGLNADVVENITATPDVLLKGNYAENVTTRGVLCTTRGNVLIEDNTFYKNGMSGVLLEDDVRAWFESGPIKNMTIKNNQFVECGGPQIFSNPQTSVYDPLKTVHSNIQIIGNEFTGNSSIKMLSTKDILIRDNVFKDGGSVELSACNGFMLDGNTGVNKTSVSNSLNERSLVEFKVKSEETIETIDRNGMTATANNERNGYGAANLLDGKENTIWHTDWDNIPEEAPYVIIDLNGSKTFNRVSYMPRQGETGGNIKAYELWIKESSDDVEFIKAAEGNGWPVDGSEKQINLEQPISAEVVKLVAVDSVYDSANRLIASGAEINFQNVLRSADEIPVGKKVTLSYTATGDHGMPSDLSQAEFTYSSNNKEVAVVNEKGIITGLKPGKAEITVVLKAYGQEFTDSAVITVTDEVYKAAEQIEIGDVQGNQMKVNITPADAADDVAWSVERISGGTPSVSNAGVLTITEAGRMKVTAFSKNDPEIKDEAIVIAVPMGDGTTAFNWVRENKNNWSLNENNGLNLKLEPGAIWSNTNSVKNVLTKDVGEENYSIVTKMNYKPSADYAEAGIAFYVDDDNYIFLSRKKHSGYGGNIFSMITEEGGSPLESPADNLVKDEVQGKDIYLKLQKEGNQYSGYYSEDGESWKTVWEDRELNLGAIPKAAVIGYGGGNETVVYNYLEIGGEKITFEQLLPEITAERGIISSIETPMDIQAFVGTPVEELNLVANLEVTWNEKYKDRVPVQWDMSGYDETQDTGIYTYTGTLLGVEDENIGEGVDIALQLSLTADKTELTAVIELAKLRRQAAYTEDSWLVFAERLEEAEEVHGREDASQAETDEKSKILAEAMEALEVNGSVEGLNELAAGAEEVIALYEQLLYDDTLQEEEWQNGYYSAKQYEELKKSLDDAYNILSSLTEVNVDTSNNEEVSDIPTTETAEQFETELASEDGLTEEQKVELVTGIKNLQSAADAFIQSRHTVNVQELKVWLNVVTEPQKYTPENWETLMQTLKAGADIIDPANGENYTLKQINDAIAEIKTAYENQITETPGDGSGDNDQTEDGNHPGDGNQSGSGNKPGDGNQSGAGTSDNSDRDNVKKVDNPKTGDDGMSKSAGFVVLMCISLGCAIGIVVKKKKMK